MDINIKELQKVELDILKIFIHICKKENLKYYIIGGTLIGAIRHKGFIPWDDDIDIGMPREDYERFLDLAQQYLPKHYFLQTFKTDPNWPANCAKIRNSNTTFLEKCLQTFDINFGVYIDIFPLDFYPTSFFLKLYVNLKNKILVYRIKKDYFNSDKKQSFSIKEVIKNIIFPIVKCLYPTTRDAVYAREKIIRSSNRSLVYRNWDGVWYEKEVWKIDWFAEGIDVKFEDITVKAPKEYDKILRQVYGDYMQLPPKEKQILKHGAVVIDLNQSYTYYTKKETKK